MARNAHEKGMKTRRQVLGNEWVDEAERTKTTFNEDFQHLVTVYAWNEIWNRPHFPHATRRLLVLAMTASLARWDEFRLHVRAALTSGDLSEDDIKEVLLQAAVYCGIPVANTAFRQAREVIAEIGQRHARTGAATRRSGKPDERRDRPEQSRAAAKSPRRPR